MNKRTRLLLYPLLFALLLFLLWVVFDRPRFTAERAFHRVETREMLAPSAYLGHWESAGNPRKHTYLVAGVTDRYLRMTHVQWEGLLWSSPLELFRFPLYTYTFGLVPLEGPVAVQGPSREGKCGFLYTKQPYARGEVILRAGEGRTAAGHFTAGAEDICFFSFVDLSADGEAAASPGWLDSGILLTTPELPPERTLELILYDETGKEIARVVRSLSQTEA